MARKRNTGFKLRFPEFILIGLLLFSTISLGFSSGSFILNIKEFGFGIVSSVEKGFSYLTSSIGDTIHSVKELKELKKDYNDLIERLENYEELQRSNA